MGVKKITFIVKLSSLPKEWTQTITSEHILTKRPVSCEQNEVKKPFTPLGKLYYMWKNIEQHSERVVAES